MKLRVSRVVTMMVKVKAALPLRPKWSAGWRPPIITHLELHISRLAVALADAIDIETVSGDGKTAPAVATSVECWVVSDDGLPPRTPHR